MRLFLSPANKIWILFPNNSLYLINYFRKMVVMTIVNAGQYQEKAGRYMLFSSSTSVSVLVIYFTQIKGGSSLQNATLHSLGLSGKRVVIR